MKKNRLNVANLEATEILSRDQLKSIFGGSGSGSGSASDLCAGKSSTTKCTDANDKVLSSSSGIGCPSSNTYPEGQYLTCSC
jgi:ABC-type molybdate transport system ATPase subunit